VFKNSVKTQLCWVKIYTTIFQITRQHEVTTSAHLVDCWVDFESLILYILFLKSDVMIAWRKWIQSLVEWNIPSGKTFGQIILYQLFLNGIF